MALATGGTGGLSASPPMRKQRVAFVSPDYSGFGGNTQMSEFAADDGAQCVLGKMVVT